MSRGGRGCRHSRVSWLGAPLVLLPCSRESSCVGTLAVRQQRARPLPACLPACRPRPGTVPVPGIGFKFVNNSTLGLVDVNRAREVLPTACTRLPASSPLSFHYASSPGGVSLSLFLLSSGTCAALSSCPTGGLVWALYHSSLLSHVSLCFVSWLCPGLSSSIPTLGQQAVAKLSGGSCLRGTD